MKLTYEERLLVVEDHKRYGTAYTSWKRGLSERYVRTIRNIQNKLDMILLGCSNILIPLPNRGETGLKVA